MGIVDVRLCYQPFDYDWAFEYWNKQQMAHWLPAEVQLGSDVEDWKSRLTDIEKEVIGRTLKGFVQTEVLINDYWSSKVSRWFPKPEIAMMSSVFANMETVHAVAYAYLQETLGLTDFDAFLHEPSAAAKINRLMNAKGESLEDIARSLAVFSAFNEGVNLFSSFAILMSFSRRNLLKGVGQIIAWSIRDESMHSEAGCRLFRTLVDENPNLLTPELKEELLEAARLTVQLEDDFIDKSFAEGEIEGLDVADLKAYIRFRTNTKLKDLGLRSIWRPDKERLENLNWFSVLSSGVELQDFFAGRVTDYSKGAVDFEDVWSENELQEQAA